MSDDLALAGQHEHSLAIVNAPVAPTLSNPRQAFAWALLASQALPATAVAPLNVDIKMAPAIVLGALPKIIRYRTPLASLTEFDVIHVDTLALHAHATMHAESHYMGVSRGPALVPQLVEQARAWRALFLQDMTVMVTRRLLPAEKHAELKVQASYQKLPYFLFALVNVYRAAWPNVREHSTVRERELDAAEYTAEQLATAFATRSDRNQAINEANEQRRRNFTLLAQAYDQVRRGLTYLRWSEGDVDEIAPSLYRGRGGSRRKINPITAQAEAEVEAR